MHFPKSGYSNEEDVAIGKKTTGEGAKFNFVINLRTSQEPLSLVSCVISHTEECLNNRHVSSY